MEQRFMRTLLLVDTREHRTKEFAEEVKKSHYEIVPATLDYGDYALNIFSEKGTWYYPNITKWGQCSTRIFPTIAVERKHPGELIQCLTYDTQDHDQQRHFRFIDLIGRVIKHNAILIISVDEGLQTLNDALKEKDMTKDEFDNLIKIYKERYGLRFIFLRDINEDGNLNKIVKILQVYMAKMTF